MTENIPLDKRQKKLLKQIGKKKRTPSIKSTIIKIVDEAIKKEEYISGEKKLKASLTTTKI